jgi:hypothetical protein
VKLLALAGAAFVLLIVDVLVLMLIVMPLVATTRTVPSVTLARPTGSGGLALLLPTRDPRAPWPTATPAQTVPAWQTLPPTPEPPPATSVQAPAGSTPPQSTLLPATPEPRGTTALPRSTLASAAPRSVSVESTVLPETPSPSAKTSGSALVTTPTPIQQPASMPAITPTISAGPPSEIPTTVTETPTATPAETPLPPTVPATLDDLPDFETYMRTYRNAIAGQTLDIVSLTVDRTNDAVPRFVLHVAGSEANSVFAAQSAADVLDYGSGFLDDAKRYLGGAYCDIAVESAYSATNSEACSQAPAWCELGPHDQATNTWTVTWTYVRGTFTGGAYAVEAWNMGK